MSEEELIEKHKDILDLRGGYGMNCWEGWHGIIDDMLDTISNGVHINTKLRARFGAVDGKTGNIKVVQIKEKFGALRVYIEPYDVYTQGIIDMAETVSKHTCERCGKPGELWSVGWSKTLCLDHYSARKLELAVQKKDERN